MHEVRIDKATRQVAATWDELSAGQLLALVPILAGSYADAWRQRLDVLRLLLGISPALLLRLTSVQLVEISWLAGFLLDEPCTLTRQLLPRLRLGLRRYHGPAAGLTNLRFLEFVFADSYFIAYARTQDATWLDQLLAVLYRPARLAGAAAAGDPRQPFNEHLLSRRAARLARLPLATKLAILTWYRGCRHALEHRYPRVFAAPEASAAPAEGGDWGRVLRELSGQAFGDFDATGRQHLHTVLAKMQDDLTRAAQLQAQQPAA